MINFQDCHFQNVVEGGNKVFNPVEQNNKCDIPAKKNNSGNGNKVGPYEGQKRQLVFFFVAS
jgi:hypothetical protein